MRKLKFALTLFFICMIVQLFSQINCTYNTVSYPTGKTFECSNFEWELVLNENFNGNTLDQGLWDTKYNNPPPSDEVLFQGGTREGARYLPENLEVSDGILKIITKYEASTYEGVFGVDENSPPDLVGNAGDNFSYDFNYTSGLIATNTGFNAEHGLKIEARFKLPAGEGLWPAFWIYGGGAGEVDFFEPKNHNEDNAANFTSHSPSPMPKICRSFYDVNSEEWHTWTAEIYENFIYVKIDGNEVVQYARLFQGDIPVGYCGQYLPAGAYSEVFQYPDTKGNYRVIFNTAVYRPYGDDSSVQQIPAEFEIDYVKVYTKTKCPDSPIVACEENSNNPIVTINQDTEWNECDTKNIADQFRFITVTNNSTLEIKDSEIKMLLPGEIIVESGSTLLLDNTTIRPCEVGTRWRGIFLENGASIKMKNESVIKTSRLGIYNHPDLNNHINEAGDMDVYNLLYDISPTAGNNSVIINNSSLIDNFNGITIDGDDNIISLVQGNARIEDSNIATLIRGNINGYIEYKNVTFENNGVSLRAAFCGDRHVIHDCEFINDNNITTQIWLKDVDGLDFQMNKMEGPGRLFDAYESYVDIVNDNQFLNAQSALWISGSYPLAAGAKIGDLNGIPNYFSGNDYSIDVNGLNSTIGGIIQNNEIVNTSMTALEVSGINRSRISNNTIENAEDGILFSKTGGLASFINCNLFESNAHQDLTIELDNDRTLFLQNDFSSSQNEGNIILSEAIVQNVQGIESNPSDNCFNQNAIEDLYTDNATSFFQYHHNQVIPCRIPSGSGNYQPLGTFAEGDNCPSDQIGSNFVGNPPGSELTPIGIVPPLTPHPPVIVGPNVDDVLNDLVSSGGDDPYTYTDESLPNTEILPNVIYSSSYLANIQAIYNYESELDYWIRVGIQYALLNEDYVYGENLLLPFKKWRWQELLFGLYIKSNQYNKARSLLNVLPNNTNYEGEFIALQHINMDRLINGESSITLPQIQTVHAIATGTTPASGYAIPLYYYLTGIHIRSTVPAKGSGTRNNKKSEDKVGINIIPNPVGDLLTVSNTQNRKLSDIKIIDQYNQVSVRLSADNIDKVNISNLVSGWYMLTCVADNKDIITIPFMKL